MKEILKIIHDTIYQFFDTCEDDEEVPMSDKDKLLLEVNKAICNNLKELEQTRWIPVSERLPEDIRPVIVTWKNNDPKSYYQYIVGKHFIGTAYFKNGKWFWYSSVTEDLLAEYGKCDSEEFDEAIEVVAWMPLPTPYKAESKLDGDPIDIDKAVEHYDGKLEVLKGVGLEVNE